MRAHRARLVRFAALVAGDVHRGEDALQTALTRVYVAWPRLSDHAHADAYVRRSIVNAVIDESRRPWRRVEFLTGHLTDHISDHIADHLVYASADPFDDRASDDLLGAVSALPPRMRSVIVLRFYEDMSVADTARLLGCTEGNVKSQCARALDKLRERIGSVDDCVTDEAVRTAESRIA